MTDKSNMTDLTPNAPQVANVQFVYPNPQEEDISLYEVWQFLRDYKFHIAGVTLAFTLAAVGVALWLPPVYQAKAYISPPNASDIQALTLAGNSLSGEKTPDMIFQEFLQHFNSRSLRLQYFEDNNLLKALTDDGENPSHPLEVFEEEFDALLSFAYRGKDIKGQELNQVETSLEGNEPEQITQWLNEFLQRVNQRTVDLIKQDLQAEIVSKKQELTNRIQQLWVEAEAQQSEEIARLKESFTIAKELGIEQPYSLADFNASSDSTNIGVNVYEIPDYLRGSEALSMEIEALENRNKGQTEDIESRSLYDSYIKELPDLRLRLANLDTLATQLAEASDLHAVFIEQYAVTPYERIKPKRTLIVLMGFVSGVFAGILLSLGFNIRRK